MAKRKERIDRGIKVRSSDLFALSSWREMLYLAAPRVLPIMIIIFLALFLGPYWQRVLLSVAVFGILSLSWDMLNQTGMISLGQSLFFGIGAYFSGVLNFYFGWHPFITIPVAMVAGGLFSTFILMPLVRLRGIYFSMTTLILPIFFERLIEATRIFGGTEGLTGLDGLTFSWLELYLPLIFLLLVLFGFRRFMSSDYGLVLKGIHDNDQSVKSSGININNYKAFVLFIASAVGCFAGAFITHVYLFVGVPDFALDYAILPIAASVVGGVGTFAGPVLGAFILVPLSEMLREFGGLRIVFYGMFLVFFIVALPDGIFPYIQRKYQQFERWVEVK